MRVNELRALIFENYYIPSGFVKEKIYYSMKRLKKKKRFIVASNSINRKNT